MKTIALLFVLGLTSRNCAMTFDETISATLARNPTIQAARSNLEAAAGRKVVLHAMAYPSARLDLFGGAQGGHRAGQPAIQPFGFVRGAFIQPLFDLAVQGSWRRGNIEV